MADSNHQEIWDEFRSLVNMTPSELENWLDSDESKAVGQKSEDGGESVGHKSGHTIIEIKHTKKADLSDDQWAHNATPSRSRRATSPTRTGAIPS